MLLYRSRQRYFKNDIYRSTHFDNKSDGGHKINLHRQSELPFFMNKKNIESKYKVGLSLVILAIVSSTIYLLLVML